MAKIRGAVTVNIERCKGCNLCVVACPTKTLSLQPNEVNDRGYHYAYMANPESCTGCCSCAWYVPTLVSKYIANALTKRMRDNSINPTKKTQRQGI